MGSLRRSTRSPYTPPQGPTSNTGKALNAPTITTCKTDVDDSTVKSRTSQPMDSSCSH
jgi:hypothetical protein